MDTKTKSLYIGRFQPFHRGHKTIVQQLLDEGRSVCVALRDTGIDENNPYSIQERELQIRASFPNSDEVQIIVIPDISEMVYGRNVGYGIREIRLSPDLEEISGSKIRSVI